MKKILITGALGHIGSKLIHSIKSGQFDEVRLIDNLLTQRYASLFNLPKDVPYTFIEDDVCTANLATLFEGIDVVIHLAAISTAAGSFENQSQVEQVNYEGTKCVAEACVKSGSKLIFPSTTSVYGTLENVVDENCSEYDWQPQSPYAESKLRGERYLERLGKEKGLKFVICRFGTIYGTSIGMRFHTAISKFCWQACLGQPITVWRTALHQKRPYLALHDAVPALYFVMTNDLFDHRVYNVVTDNLMVSSIIQIIEKYIPGIKIQYVDTKIMNRLSYEVSNVRFKEQGFEFTGSVEQGINETIKLLENVRGNYAK